MKFSATQSGIVLLPRTIAMMFASPFVGRLYNKISPAVLVGFGMVMTALGSLMQADITLATSTHDLILPLAITGVGFAFLFVPLTTAALSNVPRHEMAAAAGVNSFVRQIGASIGLSVAATLFTRYALEAKSGLTSNITILRPELGLSTASALTRAGLGGRAALQGTVIGFDKTFLLQTFSFLAMIPLLFFLRVKRTPSDEKVHVDLPVE
jgi:DHA2 family multidrug resistance protein